MTLLEQFLAARRAATPLVAIATTEPADVVRTLRFATDHSNPCFIWDCMRGLRGVGKQNERIVDDFNLPPLSDRNLAFLLNHCVGLLREQALLIAMNATRMFMGAGGQVDIATVQAIWNCRDTLKQHGCMLAMVGADAELPPELAHDVTVIDDPLPDDKTLTDIVTAVCRQSRLKPPAEPIMARAVEALLGLSAFAAEQATCECLSGNSLNLALLWERKRRLIEQTPGLSVYRGTETFEQLGGLSNLKEFLRGVLGGAERPNVVVFVDEIEKAVAGQGDTSGVSQDQLNCLLRHMRDRQASGILLNGFTGTGKSAIAKATGNEGKIPCVSLDLGSCKGSLVGESERRLRAALKVIHAVGNGRELWIATCNSLGAMPPELLGRFDLGTWFLDLPCEDDTADIWGLWKQHYGIMDDEPSCHGWTGDEIRRCCRNAHRLNVPLSKAREYVVPLIESDPEMIRGLRSQAEGRFLNASAPGVYTRRVCVDDEPERVGRRLNALV